MMDILFDIDILIKDKDGNINIATILHNRNGKFECHLYHKTIEVDDIDSDDYDVFYNLEKGKKDMDEKRKITSCVRWALLRYGIDIKLKRDEFENNVHEFNNIISAINYFKQQSMKYMLCCINY